MPGGEAAEGEGVPFRVGEEVECTTFLEGYRGAWFRCKILAWTLPRSGPRCRVRYLDYEDRSYTHKLYQGIPGKPHKKLMLRPPYPPGAAKAMDRDWAVGDHADLAENGAFWECVLAEIDADELVTVRCPGFPFGEGEECHARKNPSCSANRSIGPSSICSRDCTVDTPVDRAANRRWRLP